MQISCNEYELAFIVMIVKLRYLEVYIKLWIIFVFTLEVKVLSSLSLTY